MSKVTLLSIALLLTMIAGGQNLPKTILWEVSQNGNTHKSYLFGTFHEVDPTFFEGLPNAMSKLKESDVLFVEQNQIISNTLNTNDNSLWSMDKWQTFLTHRQDSIFIAFTTKAENNNYYYLPPLALCLQTGRLYLQNFCDTDERTTDELMDQFIANIATGQNKKIFSLDENQVTMLKNVQASLTYSQDSLYASAGIDYMESMLNNDPSGCAILTDYKTFNLNYALDKDVTQVTEDWVILIERNKKWLSILDKAFLQNNCFVAVGFKHLFYKQGLIQLLRNSRYTVTPIPTR